MGVADTPGDKLGIENCREYYDYPDPEPRFEEEIDPVSKLAKFLKMGFQEKEKISFAHLMALRSLLDTRLPSLSLTGILLTWGSGSCLASWLALRRGRGLLCDIV